MATEKCPRCGNDKRNVKNFACNNYLSDADPDPWHDAPSAEAALPCNVCGYTKDKNDAHVGISHIPFSKAHTFVPRSGQPTDPSAEAAPVPNDDVCPGCYNSYSYCDCGNSPTAAPEGRKELREIEKDWPYGNLLLFRESLERAYSAGAASMKQQREHSYHEDCGCDICERVRGGRR